MPDALQITDISNGQELIRYAVASQCAQLVAQQMISQNAIARAIGMEQGNFSNALRYPPPVGQNFTDNQLKQLDEVFVALGLARSGGLTALAVRLRGSDGGTSLDAHIPPGWARTMLRSPSRQELGVLIQAAALVSMQRAAFRAERPLALQVDIQRVVRQLVLMGAAPPTRRNVEALVLLGLLAGYSFDLIQVELEQALCSEWMPFGFRVWRAVTKSVLLNSASKNTGKAAETTTLALREFVERMLTDAENLRDESLYPGRSLDMELAISVPAHWSPPGTDQDGHDQDWVQRVLLTRARNKHATLRERGTAALGLWQRTIADKGRDRAAVERELLALIKEFRESPDRPDVAAGMRWVADTIEKVVRSGEGVCNQWPTVDEPWMLAVKQATASLARHGIPSHLLPATRTLFEHALLQNAGVHRRQAIDTLVASGWAEKVTPAFITLLNTLPHESWLRIRALFALGFLQDTGAAISAALAGACTHVYKKLDRDPEANPPALITELHAALFAIGDCFGPHTVDPRSTRQVRERIRPILDDLVGNERTTARCMWPIARAIGYLLTVTAQPRPPEQAEADLSHRLLTQLSGHPDEVTAKLSQWALTKRFGQDGTVIRPLLDAAHEAVDGSEDPLTSTWSGFVSDDPR